MVASEYQWIPVTRDAYRRRLRRLDRQMNHLYPGYVDALTVAHRAARGQVPDWCWLPLARASEVLDGLAVHSGVADAHQGVVRDHHAAVATALAAWTASGRRMFYPHESIDSSPAPSEPIPFDALTRLPEPCVYLALDTADPRSGVFAHLNWNAGEQRADLRLVIDLPEYTMLGELDVHAIPLTGGSLRDAVAGIWSADRLSGSPVRQGTEFGRQVDEQATKIGGLIHALAFLGDPDAVMFDADNILGGSDEFYRPGTGTPDDPPALILVIPADPDAPGR